MYEQRALFLDYAYYIKVYIYVQIHKTNLVALLTVRIVIFSEKFPFKSLGTAFTPGLENIKHKLLIISYFLLKISVI